MLLYGVLNFFYYSLHRLVFVVNVQSRFDDHGLKNSSFLNHQPLFVKGATESINNNWNYDGFEFLDNYIKDVPEEKRAPVLVFSGKDLTDVQEDLLKERVVGLVKKDDVSMDNLSKMIQSIVKS